jgi:hypothetical protein
LNAFGLRLATERRRQGEDKEAHQATLCTPHGKGEE